MAYLGRVKPTETTSSVLRSTYTGNGSTTTYALPGPVANETSIIATINGVTQQDAAYSTDGSNIIFDAAPASGDSIEIRTISAVAMSYAPMAGSVVTGILADGAVTTGKLATGAAVANIGARAITAAQVPTGSVIQVVQYVISGSSYTTFTGFNTNTQIQGSITPTSTSSKILITMNYNIGTSTTSLAMCTAQITRNGTNIFSFGQIAGNVVSTRSLQNVSHTYLDSPNTTSSTAYRLQVNSVDGATCYVGAWGYAPADWNTNCMLTLMEIAG